MLRGKRAWWLLLAVVVAVLDLWSKGLWRYPAQVGDPHIVERVVFESWLQIRTTWNEGGVWSLPLGAQVLKWATFLAIPLLVVWIFYPRRARPWDTAAKAVILGGAVGNLYDRMRWGAVRDFIDVYFGGVKGWHWPTFNVADMALVCGICLLLLMSFRQHDAVKEAAA